MPVRDAGDQQLEFDRAGDRGDVAKRRVALEHWLVGTAGAAAQLQVVVHDRKIRPSPGRQSVEHADELLTRVTAAARAAARSISTARINTAAEVDANTDVHARTVEHKTVVRAWVTDLAQRAGAKDSELLARQLTLLIDGGLASGGLDAEPSAAEAAKQAARALIDIACP